jgi:hypothetical protein
LSQNAHMLSWHRVSANAVDLPYALAKTYVRLSLIAACQQLGKSGANRLHSRMFIMPQDIWRA